MAAESLSRSQSSLRPRSPPGQLPPPVERHYPYKRGMGAGQSSRKRKRSRYDAERKEPAVPPSLAEWRARLRKIAAKRRGGITVWLLNAKGCVSPFLVSDHDDLKDLMFAADSEELRNYKRATSHVFDCDHLVLKTGPNRKVYMISKPMSMSRDANLNVPASRILLEGFNIEPPMIELDRDNMFDYFDCLPSDHVVLCTSTNYDTLSEYSYAELMRDWPYLFPQTWAFREQPQLVPYRRLIAERYTQGPKQALTEYERMGKRNALVDGIIKEYLKLDVGPISHWDKAQLLVLGAACAMKYQRDWDPAHTKPRTVQLVL